MVSDQFLKFGCGFAWQARWALQRAKSDKNVRVLLGICKEAFHVAGTLQETFPSDMLGGQGADFVRGVFIFVA